MADGGTATLAPSVPRFKPYPAYKDSGVEWLGRIPAHWQVRRLKTFADVQLSNVDKKSVEGEEPVRLCNYVDVYYNEVITRGLEFMEATATPEQLRRFSLHAGDVLITKDSESWTDIAVPAVVAEDLPGVLCGYHLAHIRPQTGCDGAFLARAFSGVGPRDQFQVGANGITRFGLTGDAIRSGLFALPPLDEQRAIATFLERETARIDTLVAKKNRLIELLEEKRIALITHAVSRGLDPNAPTKDSGIDWLGGIPAHWEVVRLRRLAPFITSGSRGWADYYADGGALFLRIGNLRQGTLELDLSDVQHVDPPSGSEGHRTRVRRGDVLVSITANVGAVGVVPSTISEAYVNQHIALIRVADTRVLPRWLGFCLLSRVGQEQLHAELYGGTKDGLGLEDIRSLIVLLPPADEQERLAHFLGDSFSAAEAMKGTIQTGIASLTEFRAALISAAVTGQIDVREEVA